MDDASDMEQLGMRRFEERVGVQRKAWTGKNATSVRETLVSTIAVIFRRITTDERRQGDILL
jgi:hypothetical protein